MAQSVTVEGEREVLRTFRQRGPRSSRNIMRRVVVRLARDVRDDVRAAAREVVDERTGSLFKAIRSKRERGTPDTFEASVTINTKRGSGPIAPHWHFIEFGTVNQRPRPYIAPTVHAWEPQLPRVYRDEFGRQLERELRKGK